MNSTRAATFLPAAVGFVIFTLCVLIFFANFPLSISASFISRSGALEQVTGIWKLEGIMCKQV